MDIKRLNATLGVSPQIRPEDIAAIARAGCKSILCNRPEGKALQQPTAASVKAATKAAGLRFASVLHLCLLYRVR